jgi:hypothetical protein
MTTIHESAAADRAPAAASPTPGRIRGRYPMFARALRWDDGHMILVGMDINLQFPELQGNSQGTPKAFPWS